MAAVERYWRLCAKVDRIYARVRSDYAHEMECGRGCSHCCQEGVQLARVEVDAIAGVTARLPQPKRDALANTVRTRLLDREHDLDSQACVALGTQGECQIYDGRPMACRHWGLLHYYPQRMRRDLIDAPISELTPAIV